MNAYVTLSLLFGLFAFVHSLTAADFFKRRVEVTLGLRGARYRLLYTLLSFPSAMPFVAYWLVKRGETPVLLSFPGFTAMLVLLVKLAGAAILAASLLQTGIAEFLGLKPEEQKRLVTSGLYAKVRHPMYLGAILFIWATPELRSLDALLYILATLYFAFGIYMEERRLREEFGDAYESYRSRVPAIIPRLK
jgi:protein-S-isoprenylcysteine O-methyltransferase Ste14